MNKITNLINSLTVEELRLVNMVSFSRNTILFSKDDYCNEIFILVKGEVQMVNYDIDGNELIFNYHYFPSIFGNNLIFSSSNQYLSDVIAVRSGKGYTIKKDNLIKIMQKNATFLKIYLEIIADKTINITKKIKIVSIQNARQRLLSYFNYASKDNIIKISSITSLAKEISLARETTSRLIYSLVEEGIVEYTNKVIKIKKNVLELL